MSDFDSDSWSFDSPISPSFFYKIKNFFFLLWVNLYMITDTYLHDPPPLTAHFSWPLPFLQSQKVVTLPLFPPRHPLLISDKSLTERFFARRLVESCDGSEHVRSAWKWRDGGAICFSPRYTHDFPRNFNGNGCQWSWMKQIDNHFPWSLLLWILQVTLKCSKLCSVPLEFWTIWRHFCGRRKYRRRKIVVDLLSIDLHKFCAKVRR